MYFIGLDVHKKTISYCVRDARRVHQEGKVGSTLRDLDCWIRTLPQPRTIAMEATIFMGWIYDHLLPPPQFTPLSRHRLSSSVSSCISSKSGQPYGIPRQTR
jgi:hypothetical protein